MIKEKQNANENKSAKENIMEMKKKQEKIDKRKKFRKRFLLLVSCIVIVIGLASFKSDAKSNTSFKYEEVIAEIRRYRYYC